MAVGLFGSFIFDSFGALWLDRLNLFGGNAKQGFGIEEEVLSAGPRTRDRAEIRRNTLAADLRVPLCIGVGTGESVRANFFLAQQQLQYTVGWGEYGTAG